MATGQPRRKREAAGLTHAGVKTWCVQVEVRQGIGGLAGARRSLPPSRTCGVVDAQDNGHGVKAGPRPPASPLSGSRGPRGPGRGGGTGAPDSGRATRPASSRRPPPLETDEAARRVERLLLGRAPASAAGPAAPAHLLGESAGPQPLACRTLERVDHGVGADHRHDQGVAPLATVRMVLEEPPGQVADTPARGGNRAAPSKLQTRARIIDPPEDQYDSLIVVLSASCAPRSGSSMCSQSRRRPVIAAPSGAVLGVVFRFVAPQVQRWRRSYSVASSGCGRRRACSRRCRYAGCRSRAHSGRHCMR